ncbi:hypothetical protein [Caballeronia grimmiae]|uniref:hypothetical protein n=1 Tax=Caballeronia grimmiae TaxID=1071679 RepID=UPI0038BBC500
MRVPGLERKHSAIVVATEAVADAGLVSILLQDGFNSVFTSPRPAMAVRDFELYRPVVVVLAFGAFWSAQRYYLGLYRFSAVVRAVPHRTIVLCARTKLLQAYDLRKKEHLDDHVLFWPH